MSLAYAPDQALVQILLFPKPFKTWTCAPWLESLRANRTSPCPRVGVPQAPVTRPFGRPLGVPHHMQLHMLVELVAQTRPNKLNKTLPEVDTHAAIRGSSSGPGCSGWSNSV